MQPCGANFRPSTQLAMPALRLAAASCATASELASAPASCRFPQRRFISLRSGSGPIMSWLAIDSIAAVARGAAMLELLNRDIDALPNAEDLSRVCPQRP